MILVFGGTTEGKKVAALLNNAGKEFLYSTKTTTNSGDFGNAVFLSGAMDRDAIRELCLEKSVKLIVDAAHPFAEELHGNIAKVSDDMNIPVIRYSRIFPDRDPDFQWCDSYEHAVEYIKSQNITSLLALSGVQTIPKLKDYWQDNECWFRILKTRRSLEMALSFGFPEDRLLVFDADVDNEEEILKELIPKAIITKESGESGFFTRKVEAAKRCGVKVIVVKRPELSKNFINVSNEKAFEEKVREIYPEFFPLRSGFTTGSCATAAAKAAALFLLTGKEQEEVEIFLPDGSPVNFAIEKSHKDGEYYSCTVRKYSGDDPDVTHGMLIGARLSFNDENKIVFKKGEGVGTITLKGFETGIGEPAINPVPRKMITQSVTSVLDIYEEDRGIDVSIFVPGGEEVAAKTLNPKLGIKGGISIIGTSGIVRPFSKDAFVASIKREIDIAVANNCKHIVINSGAKSENYLKAHFSQLNEKAFVQYGNFIGETIKKANECKVDKLSLGIMIGKAVKLADGHLDTHSKHVLMNKDFLINLIKQDDVYGNDYIEKIKNLNLARELSNIFKFSAEEPFFIRLMESCYNVCKSVAGDMELEVLLISNDGDIISL